MPPTPRLVVLPRHGALPHREVESVLKSRLSSCRRFHCLVSAPRRLGMPNVLKGVGWFQDRDVPWAYCLRVGPLGVPLSFFTPRGPSFWSFLRVMCYLAYFLENTAPSMALLVSCYGSGGLWLVHLTGCHDLGDKPLLVCKGVSRLGGW